MNLTEDIEFVRGNRFINFLLGFYWVFTCFFLYPRGAFNPPGA